MPDIPSAKNQYIPEKENARKIIVLFAMMMAVFYLGDAIGPHIDASARGVVLGITLLALGTFASMIMLAMAILAHDGVHKVLFRSVFWNDLMSGILSGLGGAIPFYANRQFHLTHHSYSHQGEADPEHEMHNKPFWYAVFIGSFIGLLVQYRTLRRNIKRGFNDRKYMIRALKDIGFVAFTLFFYVPFLMMIGINPLYSFVPAMLMFPFTFAYRAMSDHYGLPKVRRKSAIYQEVLESTDEENQRIENFSKDQVSGWVVHTTPFIEWLWSSVNYHEVHHKFPYLSHIHLKPVFEATRDTHSYREVNGFTRSLIDLRHKNYYEEA